METPARVVKVLNLIALFWMKYPNQRFGQILVNAGILEHEHSVSGDIEWTGIDPYYISDATVIGKLEALCRSHDIDTTGA